jgi:hypothetical protein
MAFSELFGTKLYGWNTCKQKVRTKAVAFIVGLVR